eukprot:TRINITY_DN3625_c0_g1_i1.p1 TRINITY_DN3625_c0_g1~~TRINITY_DN3625_c0_g1_i1.p1  ORF type:complete len:405 (+),score=117.79 TRINITY_DN3625_c0_g1_i1:55-1215(+)
MDVSVVHMDTGRSCVVGVSDSDTVTDLKVGALQAIFSGSIDAGREASGVAARIEGCDEDLDDEQRVADTPLEGGGGVQLVRRWVEVLSPATYATDGSAKTQHIALSRCGRLCALCSTGGHVQVFATTTATMLSSVMHGTAELYCSAFSWCGTWLATCSDDDTICVWHTSTWEQVCMLEGHATSVWSAAWTGCGALLSGDRSGDLRVWDLDTQTSRQLGEGRQRHTKYVYGIEVSDTRIFTASEDSTIIVWDAATYAHIDTITGEGGLHHIALTDDGKQLVSCSDRNVWHVWCTTSLQCIRTNPMEHMPYLVAVSQPGDVVAASSMDMAELWRLSTGEPLGVVPTNGEGVALSPCGRWLFTPSVGHVTVCAVRDVTRDYSTVVPTLD